MTDSYVMQEEFKPLEARVAPVEQETEGEKMTSHYILTQSRQDGDDLAALRTWVDHIEEKVDRLETGLSALRRDCRPWLPMPCGMSCATREPLRSPFPVRSRRECCSSHVAMPRHPRSLHRASRQQ